MRPTVRHRAGTGEALATTPVDAAAAPPSPSFERDILPLFRPFAAAMMWRFDLTNYEAVAGNALTIYNRISNPGAAMPPPPFSPFTADQIALFESWMNNGCNP